ncbi:MAG TPA: serine hydrolase domain-containing protein [Nitrospirota bacterium]|nr:serine hydrolase domain-containing protein [Nitrospirota bacterium]
MERTIKLPFDLSPDDAPGLQYVLVDKDHTIYEQSSGSADIVNRTPLSLKHTMAAFSMTKTITAIAILQLTQKQKLNLDDRASQFIEHPYHQQISIRQLLNHTSGIPNPIPLKWVHLAEDHKNFNEQAALAQVLESNHENVTAPGEKYAYSNIGYWLLGMVIEAAAQQDYSEYVRKCIFQPLKLAPGDIDFAVAEDATRAKGYLAKYSLLNVAKYFVMDKAVWGKYEGNWLHVKDVYVNGPSFGGAIGSAKAFSRILQDLLSDQSVLLSRDTRHILYERQKTNLGKYIEMTLAWHVGILDGIEYFYKEGGGAGFHSEMRVYPSKGLASVVMTNRTSFNSRSHLSNFDKMFFNT